MTGSGTPDGPGPAAGRARSRGGGSARPRAEAGTRARSRNPPGWAGRAGLRGRRRAPSRWRSRIRAGVLALLALVVVDAGSGLFYRTSTASTVAVFRRGPEEAKRVLVVLPGYLMSGRGVGQAFQPFLTAGDAVLAVDYGERGVDLDDVHRRVLAQLALLRPAQLVLYGPSMGGTSAAGFLQRYGAAGAPYGKVVLVLDTAPASAADVKRPGALLWAGCHLHGGVLSSVVMAAASGLSDQPVPEAGSSPEVIATAQRTGAWRGTAAATTQACFVQRSEPPAAGMFDATVGAAAYLHGVPATDDPSIDVSAAIVHWRVALPGLREVALSGRQGVWHVSPIERPRETLTAILAAAGA